MKQILDKLDTSTRRRFVERCAAASLGLSILPGNSFVSAQTREQRHPAFGKAKHVIWLMLSGGLSHIDSLDPKKGKSKGLAPAKGKNCKGSFSSNFRYEENKENNILRVQE